MRSLSVIVLAGLAAAMAACSGSGAAGSDAPAQPGTYDVTVPGGHQGIFIMGEGGEYSLLDRGNPQPIEQGEWRRRGDRFCLNDGERGERCMEEQASPDGFRLVTPTGAELVFMRGVATP